MPVVLMLAWDTVGFGERPVADSMFGADIRIQGAIEGDVSDKG